MTSRRHVLAGYFIWLTLLIVAYYGLPSLRVETWGLIGLSGVAGIGAGIVLSRLWDVAASHRRALGRERAVRGLPSPSSGSCSARR